MPLIDIDAALNASTLTVTFLVDPSVTYAVGGFDFNMMDFRDLPGLTYVGVTNGAFSPIVNPSDTADGLVSAGAAQLSSASGGSTLFSLQFSVASASTFAIPFSLAFLMTSDLIKESDNSQVQFTGPITAHCFAGGTRILTEHGPVTIEALRLGDRVAVASAREFAPVIWVGHRTVACKHSPNPEDVLPVRVRRDAFAPGRPAQDLVLSPDHAVFIDGALIPIRHLTNGASVVQEQVDRITYWHVELDQHDILFAEGLPAESYLDTGNRAAFANGGTVTMLSPQFAMRVRDALACAPLVTAGPALQRARKTLADRLPAMRPASTALAA